MARNREVISSHVSSGSSSLIEDVGNSEPPMRTSLENRNLGVNVWRAACTKGTYHVQGPVLGAFTYVVLIYPSPRPCELEIIILIFQVRKDSSIP